jgi:hypothetical protein
MKQGSNHRSTICIVTNNDIIPMPILSPPSGIFSPFVELGIATALLAYLDEASFVPQFVQSGVQACKFVDIVLIFSADLSIHFFFGWCDHHLGG